MKTGKTSAVAAAALVPGLALAHGPHGETLPGLGAHLLAHAWPVLVVLAGIALYRSIKGS